ncbi:hypothetical protein N431DRAFT_443421 [Stipitochalara longipes BDJ]|nr:hypothetical protein N431DRAFT_443421 [Stipitochalara longipes BDJ]
MSLSQTHAVEAFKQPNHGLRPWGNKPESTEEEESHSLNNQSGEKSEELSRNGFIQLNTHDTSFTGEHIPKIETFAQDLQAAVNAIWPSRGQGRYTEVHVLLLSWGDDSLGVETEVQRLGKVFSNLYRFDVKEFKIPSKTPGKATTAEVSKFLEHDQPDNLLIVYYAGHARLSHQANDPPIWLANGSSKSPTLPSGGVQQLFEEAESDVLLLYDSCHSSHPAINVSGQGVTEVIAACGFETQAPAVGQHSFTNALIRELEESFAGPPISVAELHSRMIGSLKQWKPELLRDELGNVWTDADGHPRRERHKRRTPVHCFLTNETPYRSIMLSALPNKLLQVNVERFELEASSEPSTSTSRNDNQSGSSTEETSSAPKSISARDSADSLQVLLAVRLEEDFFDADDSNQVRTWCEWLRNIPPGTRDVKIQGLYKSLSTLMIISIPAVVWNLLPNNAAYSFIGFVRSDNLIAGLRDGEVVSVREEAAALVLGAKKSLHPREEGTSADQNPELTGTTLISKPQDSVTQLPPKKAVGKSARQRSVVSRSTDPKSEDLIKQIKEIVTQLYEVVSTSPLEWESYVPSARSAITALEHIHFFRDPARLSEQIWIIQGLQAYAYLDSDNRRMQDVAEHCESAWLQVLRNDPENVEILTELGRNLLQRAQVPLARIHREKGESSSGDSGYQSTSLPSDPQEQGPLYAEARAWLQRAVEFYGRAVRSADTLESTTGDLLAAAAECEMSLGNVTSSPKDGQCFSQAIQYLRRAEAIPGYTLSVHLAQYLIDYGRYVS